MSIKSKHSVAYIMLSVFTVYRFFSYLLLIEYHHEKYQQKTSEQDGHSDATECELCKIFLEKGYLGHLKISIPFFKENKIFNVFLIENFLVYFEYYTNTRAP